MSRKDGVLDLVVKRLPFYGLRSGFKPEEYRGIGWAMKLVRPEFIHLVLRSPEMLRDEHFQPYTSARISNGYQHGRESFTRPIKRIRWGIPNPAWCYGIMKVEACFIIEVPL